MQMARRDDPGTVDPDRRAERPQGRQIRRYIELIYARDGDACCLCRRPIAMDLPGSHPDGPSIEHHLPVSKGGTNALDNLGLAHRSCNQRRGNRDPDQLVTSRQW